jgi:hypothetical protein
MKPTLLCRRAFLAGLGCALAGRPSPLLAQQETVRTVGVLIGLANDAETQARAKAFEQGLAGRGWSKEKKNLRLIYRFADGDLHRMAALAKELVALKPDCILGHSTPVVRELKKATRTVPIVFVNVTDPIGSGFASSMAHPGGNITGFSLFHGTMMGKCRVRQPYPQWCEPGNPSRSSADDLRTRDQSHNGEDAWSYGAEDLAREGQQTPLLTYGRDANGQVVAKAYFRRGENEARQANVLTHDEARPITTDRRSEPCHPPARELKISAGRSVST